MIGVACELGSFARAAVVATVCGLSLFGLACSAQPPVSGNAAAASEIVTLDDFDAEQLWSAHPADGVELDLSLDQGERGRALRLDFSFTGGGYAIARRELDVELPANYAFSFRLRGEAPVNTLEFKLIDESGENVWWHVRRDVEFPGEWKSFRVKRRQLQFAWGPRGGGELERVAAIEFAITAAEGGSGTVWIDELELHALPPADTPFPPAIVRASSSREGFDPAAVLDGEASTAWMPASEDGSAWIEIDFGRPREFGGLVLEWHEAGSCPSYEIQFSDDGRTYRGERRVGEGNGGQDPLYLPESESRFVRMELGGCAGNAVALGEIVVQPLEWSASRESFFEALASLAPRGIYPRGFVGEQAYWTVVGADQDERESLLGEDGALEIAPGGPSVEPFLWLDDRLVSWSDVRIEHSLEGGALPIPSVHWEHESFRLSITAIPVGPSAESAIGLRYRLESRREEPLEARLYLAVRPFQVNPPSQTLNRRGGTAQIERLEIREDAIWIDGRRSVLLVDPHDGGGAVAFDGGDIVLDYLRHGELPDRGELRDSFAAASAALRYDLQLDPGQAVERRMLVSLYPESPEGSWSDSWLDRGATLDLAFENSRAHWEQLLGRVEFDVPPQAEHLVESLRAQLAYVLVNRAGVAIQPGSRAYARSWIRDGTLTSTALLRLGHANAARDFLEWYAPHQYENGKIPCVVDHRGADPVPEHDSTGEFIHLVAQIHRYTGDRELAEHLWPRIVDAVGYLDALRGERRTAEFQAPEQRHFYGLLPPSISHEGYAAKPMHSYWDDFFALRGYKDAVYLARELGRSDHLGEFERSLAEFSQDLRSSLAAAMDVHGIDYIPGCADLGDFDPTSTTIALAPAGAEALAPPTAIASTFERYYDFFVARRDGAPWEAYTPYELRNVGAFIRLGWRARAHELLDFFFAHQRPAGWRHWAEVVSHDWRAPRFLGDMPHGWVGSDYIRSALDLFAYEELDSDRLILGAGIPADWLAGPTGVAVRGLATAHGSLSFRMLEQEGALIVTIDSGLRIPAGGIVLRPPLSRPPGGISVDGVPWEPTTSADEVTIRSLPARIVYRR